MTIKLRSKVNFPATVTATGGLAVAKANGVWTVEPDWSYLSLETAIPDASGRQLWTFDPVNDAYYRLSVQALIDNLPDGPPGAAATITAGTTTTGNAGTSATASNSGTSSAAIFDFAIPRGADAGMRYAFESSTSMAAPASGGLRLNNAALASVTAIAVNATNSDGVDVSDFVATWDDSTNTVKGYVEVRKEGSGAVLGLYQLTSVTDNTTWLQLAVTYVSGSGSFTAADSLYLTPYRTGNKGADGAGTGDVSGPSSSVDSEIALFNSTTGKLIKRASISGIAKLTSGVLSAAVSGTDYAPATTGSSILKASSGGFANAAAGTDYLAPAAIGTTAQAYDAQLFSNIPQNSQSAAYTLVATDAQRHILHPSSDNNARTFTIPANSSVAYPVGTAITFVNKINVVTIAINTDTLTFAGPGTTGSRSLAANGIATALKIASTEWLISGTGLT